MAREYAKDQPPGFSNRIEKVAVIGAGGRVGRHIVEELIKTGKHVVTVISRPDSTAELPKHVHATRIDYSSDDAEGSLVKVLRGQQVLIITMSRAAPSDAISKLLRAAAEAGVPYVLPNWFGHDSANDQLLKDSLFADTRDKLLGEIKSLGVSSYLLLVCNFWYEFSLGGGPNRYGFDFRNRSLILFDGGKAPINTSTWPLCGRALANLLSLKELPVDETDESPTLSQFRNCPIYVSSFRLSQLDMFESVKRVTGTADADWAITHESSEQRWKDGTAAMREGSVSGFVKLMYSRMFFPNGDGDYQTSRGLHNDLLGLPAEDLDEFTAIAVHIGETEETAGSH